jgi:hypothetical protein
MFLLCDIPTGDGNIKSFFSVYRRSIEQFRKLQKPHVKCSPWSMYPKVPPIKKCSNSQ